MAGTNELASKGLTESVDGVVCSKDVVVQEDLNVQESVAVGEDLVISGDLFIDENLTESTGLQHRYALQIQDFAVALATPRYAVVPTDGDGDVIGIYYVTTVAIAGASAVVTLTTGEGASVPTMTLTVAAMGTPGSAKSYDLSSATNTGVAAGETIILTSDGAPATGTVNVVIVIERT